MKVVKQAKNQLCQESGNALRPWSFKVFFLLFTVMWIMQSHAQTGYIYIHKKTLDEASSLDFTFNVTGGTTTVPSFSLNDKADHIALLDIGSSSTGTLWATTNVGGALYYRKEGTANWVATDVTSGALRVDGGLGETAYYTTSTGVYLYDATTSVSTLIYSGATKDIGSGWNNTPYLIDANGNILQYSGAGTTWTAFYSANTTTNLDINPTNGNVYATNTALTNVYEITPAGVATAMGKPANQTDFKDVAVDALGNVFVSGVISTAQAPEVSKWISGTSWDAYEPTAAYSYNLTGGLGGQIWSVVRFIQNLTPYHNIFSRSLAGNAAWWIDDERVRTSITNGNSEMIAVAPGTYTITEIVPGGWDLQKVTVYDPSSNSTSDVNANTATLTVAANEVVHVVFQNGVVNPFLMTNSCSTAYLEDFGTGAVSTYGPAFVGQTSYHYIGDATRASDGYYKVVSRAFPDFNNWQAITFYDHTSGNGTGRMLAVNAAFDQNEFFRRRFTGVIPGATYNFSAWIANLTPAATIKPNVSFKVVDPADNTVVASNTTGNLTGAATAWAQYKLTFVATSNVIDLMLVNNNIGGDGNDLAIDDISFTLMPGGTPVTTVVNSGCGTSGSIIINSPIDSSFEYSQDGTNWQSSTLFTNLNPGVYTTYARYAGTIGCESSITDTVKAAVCGNVLNDVNGLTDNIVNGTGTNVGGTLIAVLYDVTTGKVVDTAYVTATGSYTLHGATGDNYAVYLTTTPATIGQTVVPLITLPTGWVNTGENLGTGVGNDGTVNSILPLGTLTGSVTNANFGIEQPPVAGSGSNTEVNPNGTVQVTVPASTFTNTSLSTDATLVTSIIITDFPTGATTIVINGTSYTSATFPVGGVIVPTDASGNPTQSITVDPTNDGTTSVSVPFKSIDAAGKESTNTGSAVLNLTDCPSSITVTSTNVTTATCPSNGAFTINTNPSTGLVYQITSGPVGYPTGTQSSSTYTSLQPGTYTVFISCQANSAVSTTTTVTITSAYIEVAANNTVSNICIGGTPGTITTTASGSSAPYTYAYWQGDPAAADGTLTYGASNTYTPATFGTYNVRTKDACGVYVTQQVTLSNPYPANLCVESIFFRNENLTCNELQDSIWSYFTLAGNLQFSSLPAAGIDVDVYVNTGTCANPVQGTLVSTHHYDYTTTDKAIKVPTGVNLLYVVRTPCGESCTYCYTYDPANTAFAQNAYIVAKGCVVPGDPITYSLIVDQNVQFAVFPITYVIKNSAGAIVATYTANTIADLPHSFDGLPSDTYTATATDACGDISATTLTPPSGTPNELAVTWTSTYTGCTSIEGRTTLKILVQGVMANFANAVATIIAPSPNLVGTVSINPNGYYEWQNVIPGATYYIEINNGCGQKDTLTVVVPTDNVLIQHTNATVQQLCGGTGNIIVDAAYNGWGSFSYKITDSTGNVVGNGGIPGGTYSNLPAGTYTITTTIAGCNYNTYSYLSKVTILPSGSAPQIIKKLGIVCEDASGNPLTTGSAIVSFIGAEPLKVDYKLSSQPDSDYINLTNNSDGTETISGLTAGTSYTIRVTDVCGNSTVTEISIGQLTPLTTLNTDQPCVGSPYTLAVPDFIDATYSWTKNGVVISTDREIVFPSYTAAEDGIYTCTVVIADCIRRTTTTTLNSLLCGPTIQISGTVINDVNSNTLIDGTETGTTAGTNLYVYLINASGIVVDSTKVLSNGTYILDAGQNLSYTIALSTIQYAVGTNTTTTPIVTLPPSGWVTTGENGTSNTGTGDGIPDGMLSVTTGITNLINQNFGIKQAVPTANPDSATTVEDIPVTVPILTNDTFGNDGPSTGTITITDQPTNGTATVNDGGTPNDPTDDQIVYTPNVNYHGNDTLIYQICDSNGDCDTALVIISITASQGPLPVQLVSFSADLNGNNVNINWKVSQEIGVKNYEVLYSKDGFNYNAVGVLSASNSENYGFVHSSPIIGDNYYRLRTIDVDGRVSYSPIRMVRLEKLGTNFVYPNPVLEYINITFSESWIGKTIKMDLLNQLGQCVLTQQIKSAVQNERMGVGKLPSGTYVLRLQRPGKIVDYKKIVISR